MCVDSYFRGVLFSACLGCDGDRLPDNGGASEYGTFPQYTALVQYTDRISNAADYDTANAGAAAFGDDWAKPASNDAVADF